MGKLAKRSAILTGASQGFGKALARAYVAEGANVVLCARSDELLNQVQREISALASQGQQILSRVCDVSRPEEAEGLVEFALANFGQVEILVNNAGIHGPLGNLETVDWAAWVRAVEINLFGTVLTSRAIIPHFRQRKYGKIINLSGGGATKPLSGMSAYAASKAAVVRFSETLALEVRQSGIDVNALAPGAMNTRLIDEVIAAGPSAVGQEYYEQMLKIKKEGGAPMDRGAGLCVFLGSAASDGLTGKLISAMWDPWETLGDRLDAIRGDVYTLRRITPKDRGMDWGE